MKWLLPIFLISTQIAHGKMMSDPLKIVTVDSPNSFVLRMKTEDIPENKLPLARQIGAELLAALQPYLPAAGLAAPQIGISKSVFIYSYDRDPKNLEIVINPSFVPIGHNTVEGWEGCFSVILSESVWQLAWVPRYETIKATYLNQDGETVEKILTGFAAKVFQHEYDHLQGVESIERDDAIIKSFDSKEELLLFLQNVKRDDATRYTKPSR